MHCVACVLLEWRERVCALQWCDSGRRAIIAVAWLALIGLAASHCRRSVGKTSEKPLPMRWNGAQAFALRDEVLVAALEQGWRKLGFVFEGLKRLKRF